MNASAQGDASGLMGRVRGLLAGLLEILETRLELLGTDAELQAQRLRGMAVLLLAGLFLLALALVFGSLLIIAAYWDTHRLAAIGAVACVHLFAGVGCLLGLRRLVRAGPRAFEATIAELRRDVARLR